MTTNGSPTSHTDGPAGRAADLHFYFDPICPFAWLTSTWVRQVMAARDYRVQWRFISLRLLNAGVDYAAQFPPEYLAMHTAGLRMLRVAAAARAEHGPAAVDPLQAAYGQLIFECPPWPDDAARLDALGSRDQVEDALRIAGLPPALSAALDDTGWDAELRAETEAALALTGRDVGTPILHVEPPHGVAFFGPVISRRPSAEEAVALWEHVVALARFPGFAEFKRSLREEIRLPVFATTDQHSAHDAPVDGPAAQEEWFAGSRRRPTGLD